MNTPSPHALPAVRIALGLLVSLTAGEAQVTPPATLVLTEADNGTTVGAVVGQAIQVDLRGNPSTGYAWVLAGTNGGSVLPNGPVDYTQDPGGGVGRGGTFAFPFLAAGAGDTTLSFEYRPPGGGAPPQSFTVTIQVAAAPPPRLSIKLVQTAAIISWPMASSTNFFLEGSPALDPPQWAALNVAPLPEGTNYTVTLGAGGKALYFRLHHL